MPMRWAICSVASGASAAIAIRPPSSTKPCLTSWEEATCPFLRASSNLRWVGSSVFWLSSCSSAIVRTRSYNGCGKESIASSKVRSQYKSPPDRVSARTRIPTITWIGMATKKTCACGISRAISPRPR